MSRIAIALLVNVTIVFELCMCVNCHLSKVVAVANEQICMPFLYVYCCM